MVFKNYSKSLNKKSDSCPPNWGILSDLHCLAIRQSVCQCLKIT